MNDRDLTDFCEKLLPETLETLRQMVAINSFTPNIDGVNRLAHLTGKIFAPLGFAAKHVPAANPAFGDHLVLQRPPIPSAPTVALLSHLDTVYPEAEERANDFSWRVDGRRIYGPGTNDIKGGTALIWLTLQAIQAAEPELFAATNWVVLLNSCEEVVSEDFGDVCRAHLPSDTRGCLIFEADGSSDEDFCVVAARKGRATFKITVDGKGSHAGGGHAEGANAIVQLAEILPAVASLTDYAAGLTVNIGAISGGTVANRVPHRAEAILEMRAFDPAVYAQARQRILDFAGPGHVGSVDGVFCQIAVTVGHETVPWPRNPGTDGLIALWQETGASLGLPVRMQERGGLSDGNVLWRDFPTLDGLGPRGENSHCSEQSADGTKEQEWVDAASFVPKAVLNARTIARLVSAV